MLVLCVHTYVDTRLTLGPVHRNLQKGMGCQVKWYGGTHVSIQGWIQRLKKVVGTEWILVGVYITHSTLGGLGACSPRKIFFNLDHNYTNFMASVV